MSSFNRIAIVGYLGRDPELRYTPDGTPVCNFSVATTERRKDKSGELQELTTWFQVALFGRQAENVKEYLSKGSHVWLEGSLTLNNGRTGMARLASIWRFEVPISSSCLALVRKPDQAPPTERAKMT